MDAIANVVLCAYRVRMRFTRRTGTLVVFYCTVYGLTSVGSLMGMPGPDGKPFILGQALVMGMATGYHWIPVVWVLMLAVPRYHFERNSFWRPLAFYALFTVASVLYRVPGQMLLGPLIGAKGPAPSFGALLWMCTIQCVYLTLLLIGVVHGLWYARRAAERERHAEQLEANLVAARLEALRAQLDPHFLFNTLNSISELVHRDARAADRMIVGLG